MKKTYTMTDEEFTELKRLSIADHTAPVMLVGTVGRGMKTVTSARRENVPLVVARLSSGLIELRAGEPDGDYAYSQMTPETARWLAQELLAAAEPATPAGGGAE